MFHKFNRFSVLLFISPLEFFFALALCVCVYGWVRVEWASVSVVAMNCRYRCTIVCLCEQKIHLCYFKSNKSEREKILHRVIKIFFHFFCSYIDWEGKSTWLVNRNVG